MADSAIRNRSKPVTVMTPRGPVEVVRQQWRGHRRGSGWRWEYLARRRGQRDWREGATALEAIRQAALVPARKPPAWLLEAAARATEELGSPSPEPDVERAPSDDGLDGEADA